MQLFAAGCLRLISPDDVMIKRMSKTNKRETFNSFGAWSGILGPVVIGLGIIISGLGYVGIEGQPFNVLNHFVSELGELGVSDLAIAFNGGLILGGVFNIAFMIYLATQIDHWIRYPLVVVGLVTSVSGGLVGVFPMTYLDAHVVVALTFFNLGLVIAIVYSVIIHISTKHPFPKWLSIPGFLTAAAFALFLFFPSDLESELDFETGMMGHDPQSPGFRPTGSDGVDGHLRYSYLDTVVGKLSGDDAARRAAAA